MGKKRPAFHSEDGSFSISKKSRSSKAKQNREQAVSFGMRSRILKEALIQQKEILGEAEKENCATSPFLDDKVFESIPETEIEDIDDFDRFETQSQYFDDSTEQPHEDDEKLLETFFSKKPGKEQTLADIIIKKIKERERDFCSETSPLPKLDKRVIDLYKGVGRIMSTYTNGKVPKAFKLIPSMQNWEEILHLTEPENWSPAGTYQATRIFASNMGSKKAEKFYKLVLLPRVRADIRKNKRLHFALYQSLKKALFKLAAFNKGILFPLCESGTCTIREAFIIGSVLKKCSIPNKHASATLVVLAGMEYYGTTSYFIKLLLEKQHDLHLPAIGAIVNHFMRFFEDTRKMLVIWHQCLLAFVQRHKNALLMNQRSDLRKLVEKQRHKLITPEILMELDNSHCRDEPQEEEMEINRYSVINKPIEEDRFDLPDVPMED